jgi:hypothetical protein
LLERLLHLRGRGLLREREHQQKSLHMTGFLQGLQKVRDG